MILRKYLDENGIKVPFFAKKVGVSKQALYTYLEGRCRPTLEVMFKIEEQTGGKVPVKEWLFTDHCKNEAAKKTNSPQ